MNQEQRRHPGITAQQPATMTKVKIDYGHTDMHVALFFREGAPPSANSPLLLTPQQVDEMMAALKDCKDKLLAYQHSGQIAPGALNG